MNSTPGQIMDLPNARRQRQRKQIFTLSDLLTSYFIPFKLQNVNELSRNMATVVKARERNKNSSCSCSSQNFKFGHFTSLS